MTVSGTKRIAFVGDSITWGEGMLGDGFVGEAISHLQLTRADTRWPEELHLHGAHERVASRKLLGGSATRLRGAGSGVSFDWPQAELHLIVAAERERLPVRVRMLVDGRAHDEFELAPARPFETVCLRFDGDGETAEWDLGRAQTYDHCVTVDGVEVLGGLNIAGYGFAPPPEQAYTIVRKRYFCGRFSGSRRRYGDEVKWSGVTLAELIKNCGQPCPTFNNITQKEVLSYGALRYHFLPRAEPACLAGRCSTERGDRANDRPLAAAVGSCTA